MDDIHKSKPEPEAAFKAAFAPKAALRPTLERIFNAEQVGQGSCWNVMTYRREIESIIGVLESHLDRVKGWQRGDDPEQFNSEFVLLMQELEAEQHPDAEFR